MLQQQRHPLPRSLPSLVLNRPEARVCRSLSDLVMNRPKARASQHREPRLWKGALAVETPTPEQQDLGQDKVRLSLHGPVRTPVLRHV